MVDKPGRRKKNKIPWGKIVGVVVVLLLVGALGWFVYWNYVYVPRPEYAVIGTTYGPIYLELYPSCAPKTVSNFATLANTGFYDNLVWHRIVDEPPTPFVIQTGDPNTRGGVNSTRTTWGKGGSNNTVPLEICSWLHNYAGFVGMAHQVGNVNSGTSQFYIMLANQTASTYGKLEGNYTVFAKVISGMSAVCSIARSPVYNSTALLDQPINPVFMTNVTMISAASAPSPQPITACSSA